MVAVTRSGLDVGVTVLPDGFRSVSRFPDPGAFARARALLLELLAAEVGRPISTGLGRLESWESLATLCDTAWLSPARRLSRAALRVVSRRLRILGSLPLAFDVAAGQAGGGRPVHVRGRAVEIPGGLRAGLAGELAGERTSEMGTDAGNEAGGEAPTRRAPIWRVEVSHDGDREQRPWLVEEGHDFLLEGPDGGRLAVQAAGGHLVGTRVVHPGDEVSVFGFVGQIVDGAGVASSPHGRGGLIYALRSGLDLPMLVLGGVAATEA